jgi:hypothetical protein
MPARPTVRIATSGEHHAWLARHLTTRDRWLARMLCEHKVFTTHQIVQLAFPSARAANHRLRELYRWRVADRFQPFVTIGAQPMHYVLDVAGATAVAFEAGIDPADLHYRHDRAIGIAHSLRLAHTVGTNGFFTALIAASRTPHASGELTAWWSEARCGRHFGDLVRPDGYGRWHDHAHGSDLEWFLEFDFGTETLHILASKLDGYHRLAAASGITTPVLVWLSTARREASARRALSAAVAELDRPALVPVATSSADLPAGEDPGADSPAGARWLPLQPDDGRMSGRRSLADLAHAWPGLTPPTPTQPRRPAGVPQPAAPRSPAAGTPGDLAAPYPLPPGHRVRRAGP